jgi:putative transposase
MKIVVDHAQEQGLSERGACRLVDQPRGTQRYRPTPREDEDALTRAIIDLASQYGRCGYRRIAALLRDDGWRVSKDRVERIWASRGLEDVAATEARGRLWLNDGSCMRLLSQHRNYVRSYDFVSAKTYDGRTVRMLNLIGEHSREYLLVRCERRWSSAGASTTTPPGHTRRWAIDHRHRRLGRHQAWGVGSRESLRSSRLPTRQLSELRDRCVH